MHGLNQGPATNTSIVARHSHSARDAEEYLVVSPQGAPIWTADPRSATTFISMREATRAALRLPAAGCAFSLPLRPELAALAAN